MSQTNAAFLLALALVFVLLRFAAWYGLRGMERLVAIFMPGAVGHRLWAATEPARRGLRARHPRLYAVLRARLEPHHFSGLPLTLLVVGALYAAALFAGLVQAVVQEAHIVAFDQALNDGLAAVRSDFTFAVFLWLTGLGDEQSLVAVALVATGFLWAGRRIVFIAPLWLAFLGAQLTSYVGKFAVDRARPEFLDIAQAVTPSFPSGHMTGAMALYGFIAYAVARDLPFRTQFEIAYWTGVLILLVGFSRMFLGVHFLTDVLGGLLVGGFWLLAAFALAELARSRSEPPVKPE